MKRALVALIIGTVITGLAAAYASAYPRAEGGKSASDARTIARR